MAPGRTAGVRLEFAPAGTAAPALIQRTVIGKSVRCPGSSGEPAPAAGPECDHMGAATPPRPRPRPPSCGDASAAIARRCRAKQLSLYRRCSQRLRDRQMFKRDRSRAVGPRARTGAGHGQTQTASLPPVTRSARLTTRLPPAAHLAAPPTLWPPHLRVGPPPPGVGAADPGPSATTRTKIVPAGAGQSVRYPVRDHRGEDGTPASTVARLDTCPTLTLMAVLARVAVATAASAVATTNGWPRDIRDIEERLPELARVRSDDDRSLSPRL
jgi:hypothetical protein